MAVETGDPVIEFLCGGVFARGGPGEGQIEIFNRHCGKPAHRRPHFAGNMRKAIGPGRVLKLIFAVVIAAQIFGERDRAIKVSGIFLQQEHFRHRDAVATDGTIGLVFVPAVAVDIGSRRIAPQDHAQRLLPGFIAVGQIEAEGLARSPHRQAV